ncbi:MAG: RAMP superfamily CRISPR-associated protein [Bryobacteraceae bacterium]|nr:RAMP superfamily CRISPR-associated protein [Bryobacteraceae bacterium]MDW8380473.1 RAMP superfamily CRISPR-associated protein [Bryobacterales bacterium]
MSKTEPSTTGLDRLAGPGGVRRVQARWVITTEVFLETAAHFGGEGDELTDMPVLRDASSDSPLLPGTSIAGALRAVLADYLGGYLSPEPHEVAELFGGERGLDPGAQSPLIVFDSLGELPKSRGSEIRDGVSLNSATGTAEEHKKFDFEVLPSGTVFRLRMELLVEDVERESFLLGLLAVCMESLEAGELTIGMRRSRGLGRFSARNWQAYRYDLTSSGGWLEWLLSEHESPFPKNIPPQLNFASAMRIVPGVLPLRNFADQRRRLTCDLFLRQRYGLLVRSPGLTPDAPDVSHLRSGCDPVLPGTGLAGALRTRALRIARLVRSNYGDADYWVDQIFGPRPKEKDSAEASLWSSRIRISESKLSQGKPMRTSRVRIDRFTQGVVPAALFDEEPWFGGETSIRIELRNPIDGECGLLLLLVKDLLTGDLAVGGTASVGRGIFTGRAELCFPDGFLANIVPGEALENETLERLDLEIRAFHNTQPRNRSSEVRHG